MFKLPVFLEDSPFSLRLFLLLNFFLLLFTDEEVGAGDLSWDDWRELYRLLPLATFLCRADPSLSVHPFLIFYHAQVVLLILHLNFRFFLCLVLWEFLDQILSIDGLGEPLVEGYVVVSEPGAGVKQEKGQVCVDERVPCLPQHVLDHLSVQ